MGSPRFAYAKRDGGLSISTDEKLCPSEAGETDGRLDAGQRAVGSFLFLSSFHVVFLCEAAAFHLDTMKPDRNRNLSPRFLNFKDL